jgi:hypothetical protein
MTDISRRRALGLGIAAACGVALGGPLDVLGATTAGAAVPRRAPTRAPTLAPTRAPTLNTWRPLVGSKIAVSTSQGRRAELVLRSAQALRHDPHLTGDGYLLLFRGARRPMLPSGASVLRHHSFGEFKALLLPIEKPAKHQTYQLIVDRRRPVRAVRR